MVYKRKRTYAPKRGKFKKEELLVGDVVTIRTQPPDGQAVQLTLDYFVLDVFLLKNGDASYGMRQI